MSEQVAVLMGSDSDLETMKETLSVLTKFDVSFDVKVLSAHRTPEQLVTYVKEATLSGTKVFIAAAGGAAHLAGAVAANTHLPVIGVPIDATSLKGLDALLSTVQMPPGVPVATVAIGKFGAHNAALLAIQCLALSDKGLEEKLIKFKADMVGKIDAKNAKAQEVLKSL